MYSLLNILVWAGIAWAAYYFFSKLIRKSDKLSEGEKKPVDRVPATPERQEVVDANDEDDPVASLVKLCEAEPEEGLAMIQRLDAELQAKSLIRFAKFLALRNLMFSAFFSSGATSVEGKTRVEIGGLFDRFAIARGVEALGEISLIEASEPDYLVNLGFAYDMIDAVCKVVDCIEPGAVQRTLGWTKLGFLGTERMGFVPGFLDSADRSRLYASLRVKTSAAPIFRSAVGFAQLPGFTEFALLERDYNETENLDAAHILGHLKVYDDGRSTFERA